MKKIARRLFLSFSLLSLASGCAVSVSPESLMKSSRQDQIVLTERLATASLRGAGVKWEEGALPGTYKPSREDSGGVYYYGPDRSIYQVWPVGKVETRLYVGGIYLPNDTAKPPQFFYFVESHPQVIGDLDTYTQARMGTPTPGVGAGTAVAGNVLAGAVVQGLMELEAGRIVKFPPIEDPEVSRKIAEARRSL